MGIYQDQDGKKSYTQRLKQPVKSSNSIFKNSHLLQDHMNGFVTDDNDTETNVLQVAIADDASRDTQDQQQFTQIAGQEDSKLVVLNKINTDKDCEDGGANSDRLFDKSLPYVKNNQMGIGAYLPKNSESQKDFTVNQINKNYFINQRNLNTDEAVEHGPST